MILEQNRIIQKRQNLRRYDSNMERKQEIGNREENKNPNLITYIIT